MKEILLMALHLALCLCVYLLFTQGAEGSIDDFDCVEIYKQPAFQHPLLKNHKIQKRFSSYEDLERSDNYETKERCPKGTVPILKQRNGSESFHLNTAEYSGQHFATVETLVDDIYHGAGADLSVHSLNLQDNQYSKSQIWLENGYSSQLNSIQAGWAVHPKLYGDSVTRFTIYWTGDGYGKTGCYNTQCPGFIVLSTLPIIGNHFPGSSIYAKSVLYLRMQITQDENDRAWDLKLGDELVGYWPKELFTELNKGASLVRYGGNTLMSSDGMSPPMGNGHFPNDHFLKTAHYRNVEIVDSNYERVSIYNKTQRRFVDNINCFDAKYRGNYSRGSGWSFRFGGPGGNCGV